MLAIHVKKSREEPMNAQNRKIVWMCLALLGGCAGPSTVEPGSDAAVMEGQDGTQQGGTLGDGEITHGVEAGLLGKDSGGLPGKDSGLPTEAGGPNKPKVEPTLQRMSMAEAKTLVESYIPWV